MAQQRDPYADPYSAHRFWVEVHGINEAVFTECTGLTSEVELEEVKEGGQNEYIHRLPGRVKSFPNLVLKRGLATPELWEWYADVASGIKGKIKRRNITISLKGVNDAPVLRWEVIDALPIKWVGPNLKSGTGEVAVESVEFIHTGFKRA
jgi:phage tail-like protein